MNQYYSEKLAAERLKKCYDIAPPRVQQYLESEIEYVLSHIKLHDLVIELGCGYGRVLRQIVEKRANVVGIDTACESLVYAKQKWMFEDNYNLLQMDVSRLGFQDDKFDVVVCIQNGISAFKVEPQRLVQECIRITRPAGVCLFSSYCEEFWESRLEWFQLQSEEGLLGEINWDATQDGIIVCYDGFKATTMSAADFNSLAKSVEIKPRIVKVDNSSLFLELIK